MEKGKEMDGWLVPEPQKEESFLARFLGGGSHPSISLAKMVVKHQKKEKVQEAPVTRILKN